MRKLTAVRVVRPINVQTGERNGHKGHADRVVDEWVCEGLYGDEYGGQEEWVGAPRVCPAYCSSESKNQHNQQGGPPTQAHYALFVQNLQIRYFHMFGTFRHSNSETVPNNRCKDVCMFKGLVYRHDALAIGVAPVSGQQKQFRKQKRR